MKERVRDLFFKSLSIIPDTIERIEHGYSNESYRVTSSRGIFRVRIAKHNDLIDRSNELRILRLIEDNTCVYYEEDSGDSVWRWIEGDTLKKEDINEEILGKLVSIVSRLHNLEVDNLIINHDDLEFLRISRDKLKEEDVERYLRLIGKYGSEERRFCHNDISLGNLIYEKSTSELSLIDYEWGRINSPYWDYGNFIKESELSEEYILKLANIADLEINKLRDYVFIASFYSLQFSYLFPDTEGMIRYREKLNRRLEECREWLRG